MLETAQSKVEFTICKVKNDRTDGAGAQRTQNVNLQSEVIFYAEAPNDDARGLLKKEGYRLPSRDALFIIQLMIKRLFSNI